MKATPGTLAWKILLAAALCLVTLIVVPIFLPAKIPKQGRYCINNLRIMDGAIQQWALENHKKPSDTVTMHDITPYLKDNLCPQGGKYAVGPVVSNVPTCSITTHRLPP